MNLNTLKMLSHLPALLRDAKQLGTDAERLTANPEIAAELAGSPLLSAEIELAGKEWRDVEHAELDLRHSHLWNILPRAGKLVSAIRTLDGEISHAAGQPELANELVMAPKTAAAIRLISAQWRQVENDVS